MVKLNTSKFGGKASTYNGSLYGKFELECMVEPSPDTLKYFNDLQKMSGGSLLDSASRNEHHFSHNPNSRWPNKWKTCCSEEVFTFNSESPDQGIARPDFFRLRSNPLITELLYNYALTPRMTTRNNNGTCFYIDPNQDNTLTEGDLPEGISELAYFHLLNKPLQSTSLIRNYENPVILQKIINTNLYIMQYMRTFFVKENETDESPLIKPLSLRVKDINSVYRGQDSDYTNLIGKGVGNKVITSTLTSTSPDIDISLGFIIRSSAIDNPIIIEYDIRDIKSLCIDMTKISPIKYETEILLPINIMGIVTKITKKNLPGVDVPHGTPHSTYHHIVVACFYANMSDDSWGKMHKYIDLANHINILPENPRILDKKRIIQHHSKEIGTNGAPPDNFEQFFPIKKTHPFYIIWQSMKCSEIEGTIMMALTKKKTRKRKQKTKKRKRKKKKTTKYTKYTD